jgi:Flp pilus assembly protein TadD
LLLWGAAVAQPPAPITIDYPQDGSVFPPEFPAPTFVWRDASADAVAWLVEAAGIRARTSGPRLRIGPTDPRAVAPTNRPPALTPEQAAGHTWTPEAATWTALKQRPAATISIIGIDASGNAVSRGQVSIRTSSDPLGAPIFYRDVPLMPSETEKGVIKPLAKGAVPLIAWRVRNAGETSSRVVMQGLHTCANCHSVSSDGKTMGMDVDGPRNDKGLYAIFPIQPRTAIRKENVVAWSTFRGKLGGKLRVGFMSQVSPDGRYVITMINDPGLGQSEYERNKNPLDLVSNFYVGNFKDYRFLQVFYPTRGILAWYSRETGRLQPLPGADDPRYVQTNGVWSPDGNYIVFARAEARDAYPPGAKTALRANDPNETQIRYDLYRVPFNGGRGGRAEPIAGASLNGMSNSFPKVSPDGRWIVYVQARNGQLMRPDSKLYIVPAEGGQARLMRCNTPLMNSWHSFSPNGRWMVFSSKSRSPYTQMFLTHIDDAGNDSPPILIENATAANRAVNIPEFLNIPPGGLLQIDAPVADYYRILDDASELLSKGRYTEAIPVWRKALELDPEDAKTHNSLGVALARTGNVQEAVRHYQRAIALSPDYPDPHNNIGTVLAGEGRLDQAIAHFRRAVEIAPDYAEAHTNLGAMLAQQGRLAEALPHLAKAVAEQPEDANAQRNLALGLYMAGRVQEALPHAQRAVTLSGGRDPGMVELLRRLREAR